MTALNRQDLMDLLAGATIFGTGGGGDLSEGIDLIDDALAQGKTFDLVALEDVPDDALICTPYMLGAISDLPADEEAGYARLPRIDVPPILLAYERFQQHLGQSFFGTVPCEMGGSNAAVAFYAAASEVLACLGVGQDGGVLGSYDIAPSAAFIRILAANDARWVLGSLARDRVRLAHLEQQPVAFSGGLRPQIYSRYRACIVSKRHIWYLIHVTDLSLGVSVWRGLGNLH
ncbi:MAG: DUF917 family protein [Tateyamaria sp.]|uniref:S-methyl thiohydantoin desulfurase domain-containing protein n=1 Tax=Tateyamaria sp. TaxID=1929288 RepID=UPI0032A11916